jgi:hypothetical protein
MFPTPMTPILLADISLLLAWKPAKCCFRPLPGQVPKLRRHSTPLAIDERQGFFCEAKSCAPPRSEAGQEHSFGRKKFQGELDKLRQLVLVDLKKIEDGMEASGAPWTPGRLPVWKPE